MWESILLGTIQGVTEWLPISSEGVVAALHAALYDQPIADSIAYALWLHTGTALSATVAFRSEIAQLLSKVISAPKQPPRLFSYLFISTAVSGVVGFPLLLTLEELSSYFSVSAMLLVGSLMLITGGIQLFRPPAGVRVTNDISNADAIFAGIAQGLAVLPGLSRSGLTAATLLVRRIDGKSALTLSFLMSIPASMSAAAYIVANNEFSIGPEAIVGGLVAFLVGLLTIRTLIEVAARASFGPFVITVGGLMVGGAIWQYFA